MPLKGKSKKPPHSSSFNRLFHNEQTSFPWNGHRKKALNSRFFFTFLKNLFLENFFFLNIMPSTSIDLLLCYKFSVSIWINKEGLVQNFTLSFKFHPFVERILHRFISASPGKKSKDFFKICFCRIDPWHQRKRYLLCITFMVSCPQCSW